MRCGNGSESAFWVWFEDVIFGTGLHGMRWFCMGCMGTLVSGYVGM